MDAQLRTLIDLQALDTRIAGLEAELVRLPREIAAVHTAVNEATQTLESARSRLDAARKSQRAKEKDLEDNRVKRQKFEGQLYQVKTNKEYSAVLTEIEEVKQEKARIEDEILGFMEQQEQLTGDVKEAETLLRARESQGKGEEAVLAEKLRGVETDVAVVKSERAELTARAARRRPRRLRQDPPPSRHRRRRGGQAELLRGLPRHHHAPAAAGAAPAERLDPLRVLRPLPLLDRLTRPI